MTLYRIDAPVETHTRKATCAEVDCSAWRLGWTTTVDTSTRLGRDQARYIRNLSGRRLVEHREGQMVVFTFEAGQRCFGEHRVSLDRPEVYRIGRARVSPDQWIDELKEETDG